MRGKGVIVFEWDVERFLRSVIIYAAMACIGYGLAVMQLTR